ncbi:uncharacterized protein DFL_009619 [Arthrobotrys flagrans]|uniref:Uncharacterized protein n=1 Tax=Arthrobotrys flagrans TaxID=97331 RepID=A0A436ZS58_ARTFL|nr:hypothetical protein DFL_009619 [Arthrobotrys flagrans]
MQQEQHDARNTMAKTLTLDELEEYNSSGVPVVPGLTPCSRRNRGTRKYNDGLDDEELEERFARVELNSNEDTVNNRKATPVAILSRPSEKHQHGANPATIPISSTRGQNPKHRNANKTRTPHSQNPENANFSNLSKAQQRKLRNRDRLARVQQRIDTNRAYKERLLEDAKNAGGKGGTRRSETTAPGIASSTTAPHHTNHPSGARDSQPVPEFTVIQRPPRPAKTPSPVPISGPSSVDAWLYEQSTSGPWNPLQVANELHPSGNRDRRREHFQRIQSETDRDLAQLDEYLVDLETSIKKD